ncbi:unnamed protein product [Medioppia subpectinata]|uniref:3CxxC-type domain-containing protein n=2 Tax=Medioppia subpectinata TaxID=1979941 RepID=A0A7R9L4I0_9ACAR|nr:unnamed protein product [Medioppia subpectinata]CAG2115137.1 unnamed protein product [Medioppia subpectinata]
MVVFNGPIACMPSPPLTLWTASLPTSPCPLLSPLPSVSPQSSSHCSSLAPSPTTTYPTLPIATPLSLPHLNYGSSVVIRPTPWNQSYGMEQVWLSEFHRLFSNYYQQVWILQPVEHKPIANRSMHTFVDSAKVRFCCDKCGHGWTSMKGRVVFWFDLLSPYYSNGFVAFKLYGQQCDRCKTDGYEQAMWYPEEVCKVLTNLYNKVGQLFYGFYQPPIEKTRRSGKPRTPHNSDLCQACKDGLCVDRK